MTGSNLAGRRIFISYRREDCSMEARNLRSDLRVVGADAFLDVGSIRLGSDFTRQIETEVAACDAVLVMIGDDWLTVRGPDGEPRISDPRDWIHLEVSAALERNKPVIPIYVEGVRPPRPAELPEGLRALANLQGAHLREDGWEADVAHLISGLSQMLEPLPPTRPAEKQPGRKTARAPSAVGEVLIVAGRRAYPDYLRSATYVCQEGRSFRNGIQYVGFYSQKEIKPEIARLRFQRDSVEFSPASAERLRSTGDEFDRELAELIESSLDRNQEWSTRREVGARHKVMLLTPPDHEDTVRLSHPIKHVGTSAWTQAQRYASLQRLKGAAQTSDLS